MRNLLLSLLLVVAPSVAHADTIRADCDNIGQPPASARNDGPALASRLSHARCLTAATMDALKLSDDDASMRMLERAAKLELDTIAEVEQQGGPALRVQAAAARADLYFSMIVRMRNTIPLVPPQDHGNQLVADEQALRAEHDALEPKLTRWLAQGVNAVQEVQAISRRNPELAQDPVTTALIRETDRDLAAMR